jgi:Protein of unknown function (DUF2934)
MLERGEDEMSHKETQDQANTGSGMETVSLEEPNYPDAEAVARRAYEIYRERGGAHGQDLDDWVRAERELRSVSGAHESLSQ